MRFYISGKIGEEVISEATRRKFAAVEAMLQAKGYETFNPTSGEWQNLEDAQIYRNDNEKAEKGMTPLNQDWYLRKPAADGRGLLPHPCSLEDTLVYEVGLGALHLRKDIVNLLRCPEAIVVYSLTLASCALACSAPASFLLTLAVVNFYFCMKFHKVKFFGLRKKLYLCNTKPEVGEVSLPFGTLKDDSQNCYLYFPNPKENCELHRTSGFLFFLLFSRFSDSSVLFSNNDTKVRKLFEIRKQNQDYFY